MEKTEIINKLNLYCFSSFDVLRKMQGPIKKSRPKDIFILLFIYRHNDEHKVTISELANTLHVTPAAISQSVNNYEKQGWVQRVRSQQDRRTVYVQITDKAKDLLENDWANSQKKLSAYLEFLGEEDTESLVRIVEKSFTFLGLDIDDQTKEIFGLGE